MPRHIYWTIVMAEGPTAFRARDAAELLPTLKQLQRRHPEAAMKWFERGRLWDSPEAARVRPPRRTGERGRDRARGPARRSGSGPRRGPRRGPE